MKPPAEEKPRVHRTKGEGSIYRHGDGRWMYSIMHKGKRLAKSLGTRDEEQALKNYQKVRNNFMGRIDRGELEPSTVANVKLEEILDDYVTWCEVNRPRSAKNIKLTLGKVKIATEFANRKVASLTTSDFNAYRTRLVGNGASHSTVNNHTSYVRAALNLETKQTPSRVGKVPFIPIVRVNNTREGFLEYDDHEALLNALPVSLRALFVVAFHSGCRLGEILNMRFKDVDWTNRIVRLPRTKNGRQRNLPFWGSIEAHLTEQRAFRAAHHPECEHLFFWMAEDVQLSHGGVRVDPGSPIQDFRGSWVTAVKAAHKANENVPANLLFHDLRRSAVRVMVQYAGLPESQAMLISGHQTRSMLDRYNIVSLKNVQDAGSKLDAWQKARSEARENTRSKPAIRSKRPKAA